MENLYQKDEVDAQPPCGGWSSGLFYHHQEKCKLIFGATTYFAILQRGKVGTLYVKNEEFNKMPM